MTMDCSGTSDFSGAIDLRRIIDISEMALSGLVLTKDNVQTLALLCELRMQAIHTKTLLVQHQVQLQKTEGQGLPKGTKKAEIYVGAPLASQENRT